MKIPDNIDKYDILDAIDRWIIGSKAKRNRAIITSRLIDGLTYEELAELYAMSDRRIKDIVYKCETTIFKHIRK